MIEPLIVDMHLDLAWDAIFWNRDLTLPVKKVRSQEQSPPGDPSPGEERRSALAAHTSSYPYLLI